MIKIGRYKIAFGHTLWLQTRVPTEVRHFLCFWFLREASPHDVDKKQRYPLGTLLEQEGRQFRYWKVGESEEEV